MRNEPLTCPFMPTKIPFHSEHTGHDMSFRNNWKDCDASGLTPKGRKTKHRRHNTTQLEHYAVRRTQGYSGKQ